MLTQSQPNQYVYPCLQVLYHASGLAESSYFSAINIIYNISPPRTTSSTLLEMLISEKKKKTVGKKVPKKKNKTSVPPIASRKKRSNL